jgi:hypothetical protein
MKKLKLDLDHLAVESFEPSAEHQAGPGTVEGHATDYDGTCITFTCVNCGSNYRCTSYEGGTMRQCTYAPTMNPVLFECQSLAYCVPTHPYICPGVTE